MNLSIIPVLLVEDDRPFVTLLQEWLTEIHANVAVRLTHEETLQGALNRLQTESFAAVVVDLNLPDSQGMETFDRLQEVASDLPVVVLSGLNDESLALQAVRRGAQDYLIKAHVTGALLSRAVRYAMERLALRQELMRVHEQERREQERRFLDRIVNRSSVSSEMLGVPSLKLGLPDMFQNFVTRFAEALEWAMEQRTHKVQRDVSGVLATLARDLSFLKCGPRDVVELYLEALSRVDGVFNPLKDQAYSEEGRLLALELMGQLVSQYRPYALGAGRHSRTKDHV
ncbi:MAG: response regulator [Magnetococcales bacterium]|nr:response regulator [Magnetococcales bacterium]